MKKLILIVAILLLVNAYADTNPIYVNPPSVKIIPAFVDINEHKKSYNPIKREFINPIPSCKNDGTDTYPCIFYSPQEDNKCQKFLDKADQVYNILGNMKIDGMVGYKEASQKTQGLAIYADSLLKRYKLCKEVGK